MATASLLLVYFQLYLEMLLAQHCDMIFYAGMGLGVGGIFVCTFTGLSVSVPRQMTATAMTNYYLCQQLGLVVGVSVASAASRALFEKSLSQDIPPGNDQSQVCVPFLYCPLS